MKFEMKDDLLVLHPVGRIDTDNAAKADEEMTTICENNPHNRVELDLSEVDFLSSAGLRVVLRLKKRNDELAVTNVTEDVYDVFEMTGFTEMMSIHKKHNVLDLGEIKPDWYLMGTGACGTVYFVREIKIPGLNTGDVVVKVFKKEFGIEEVERELALTRQAFIKLVPTTIAFTIAKVGECYATITESLDKETLGALVAKDPEHLEIYAKAHADLLHKLHEATLPEGMVPSFKVKELKRSSVILEHLDKEDGEKYFRMLNEIPDLPGLIHGDAHVKNVMRQDGQPCFIDMDTLTHGSPIFEFARLYNAYIGYTEICDQAANHFLGIPYDKVKRLFDLTIGYYFNTDDEAKIRKVYDQAALIGLAYLYHHYYAVPGFEGRVGPRYGWLHDTLVELIHKVDTLLLD